MELVAARLDAKDCASMSAAGVAGRAAVAAARLHRAERERLLALAFAVYMDYNVMRVDGGWSMVQSSLQLVQKDKSELQWLVSTGARDVTHHGRRACVRSACAVRTQRRSSGVLSQYGSDLARNGSETVLRCVGWCGSEGSMW
jgi:hypothetical protein